MAAKGLNELSVTVRVINALLPNSPAWCTAVSGLARTTLSLYISYAFRIIFKQNVASI